MGDNTIGARRGRGRPKKDDGKIRSCNVRIDNEHAHMLDYFAINSDMSRSDVIRAAIKLYFNMNKNKY